MANRGHADADQVVGRQLLQHPASISLSRNAGVYSSRPKPVATPLRPCGDPRLRKAAPSWTTIDLCP